MQRLACVAVLAEVIAQQPRDRPLRVAFDGVDAAGKTTLADEVAAVLERHEHDVLRASIDGFHNPRHERYGDPSGRGYYERSFNHSLLIESILAPLGPGGTRRFRRAGFDFRTDAAVEAPEEIASDGAILLFDGVFLLRPELRACWDFSVFVDASFETTLARAEQRDRQLFGDANAVRARYVERYIPGQRLYLETVRPRDRADVVVDNNDVTSPSLIRVPAPRP